MIEDLSRYHQPVTNLFPELTIGEVSTVRGSESVFTRRTDTSPESKCSTTTQLDVLRDELAELVDPSHPGHNLFYEFNANESADPDQILFHALGAWRINAGIARSVMEPGFCCRGGAVARWTSAFLARSDLLQARASRRRSDLAPGLFLLDQDHADGPHLMLDWAGRFDS